MRGEEPEVPLTRAGVVLVFGGASVGLSQSAWVQPVAVSDTLLVAGVFLIAGGVVATFRVLHAHWRDGR